MNSNPLLKLKDKESIGSGQDERADLEALTTVGGHILGALPLEGLLIWICIPEHLLEQNEDTEQTWSKAKVNINLKMKHN